MHTSESIKVYHTSKVITITPQGPNKIVFYADKICRSSNSLLRSRRWGRGWSRVSNRWQGWGCGSRLSWGIGLCNFFNLSHWGSFCCFSRVNNFSVDLGASLDFPFFELSPALATFRAMVQQMALNFGPTMSLPSTLGLLGGGIVGVPDPVTLEDVLDFCDTSGGTTIVGTGSGSRILQTFLSKPHWYMFNLRLSAISVAGCRVRLSIWAKDC